LERRRDEAPDARRQPVPARDRPLHHPDAFLRQILPRWTTTAAAITAAPVAPIDRVGDAVVMVHSRAGQFGWPAVQARPAKVKALILLEPART
jgi:hypothetical protein